MKINFDTIGPYGLSKTQRKISNPIKIAVQSPIYNQIVREVSPHNYKSQITSMNKMINLPVEISRFIQMEIEKQINYGESNRIKQVQMVDIQYKQIDKKQQAIIKVSKDALKIVPETKRIEKKQKQSKTGWVFNYKKHCCQSSANLPSEVRQTLEQIREFTGTPSLYDSKISKKMSNNRKLSNYLNSTTKHYSVYENLYSDAKQRKIKAQMNKMIQQKKAPKAKPKINSNYYKNSNKSYIPLFQRLNQILVNRQAKIKSKTNINQQSGRQLFKLDLNSSRQSYNIFYQSLSKQKLAYLNKRSINLHQTKNIEQFNKINIKEKKSTENKVDTKTIQYFTQIFYPPQNNQIQLSTSTVTKSINKSQFLILHSFLHQIQQIQSKKCQMQTTVSTSKISNSAAKINNVLSKQQFQQKFKKFYQGRSLHDRQILRKQIVKRKKMAFHKQQEGILTKNTFKPSINVRSASLDNLAKRHSKNIYYV